MIAPSIQSKPVIWSSSLVNQDVADWMEHGYTQPNAHLRAFDKDRATRKEDERTHNRRMLASRHRVSAQAARMERTVSSGAAAGLVSVSTTCRASFSYLSSDTRLPESVQRERTMLEDSITIDPLQSRVRRLRKGIWVGAKSLQNGGGKGQRMWLVTLTYKGTNANWRPEQISRYLDCLRNWHYKKTGSKKVRYAWVAELQERGVIHYHVVVWLPPGLAIPKPDKSGWWPHGMSNRKEATAPIAYLMKYVSKTDSKNIGSFPHGARIYGLGGLDKSGRDCKRWVLWPSYVQGNAAAGDPWKPAVGGGYENAVTGELLLAEYVPSGAGFTRFVRVRTNPRQLDPSGPFSWLPEYSTLH